MLYWQHLGDVEVSDPLTQTIDFNVWGGGDIRSQGMLLMFCMANVEPSKNCIHTLQPSTTMNDEDIEVAGSESMQRTERSLLTISVASSCGE